MSQYKAYAWLVHMWPTVWGVSKLIFQCFKPFSSMLNLMQSGAKLNYILCIASNFTI